MVVKPKTAKQLANPGGRPPLYSSEEELLNKILKYFAHCHDNGRIRPNKAGLRLYLDIGKDTYVEYKTRFPDAMKKAEAYIEDAWVQRLDDMSPTGAIFYLKNAFKEDYKDRVAEDERQTVVNIFLPEQVKRIAGRIINGNTTSKAELDRLLNSNEHKV